MRIVKNLLVLGMCLCLSGCSLSSRQEDVYSADEFMEGKEQGMIESGNIYEITENNFVDGLDHTFTEDEIAVWDEVYAKGSFKEGEDYITEEDIKYMINLYDSNENEVGEYILDKNGQLYDGNREGRSVYNQKIMELLHNIIS